jgi:membrane-associated protease RseP (regulator of RpoE activity)
LGLPQPPTGPDRRFDPQFPYEPSPAEWASRGWVLPRLPRRTAWQRWGRNVLLFVLTALSIFVIGGLRPIETTGGDVAWVLDAVAGGQLVAGLMSILLAHELGHYLTARRYGVDATLPFFIPFPIPFLSLVGTLGAFIRIRAPIPHRKALFDIGVAGPLAGFAVCVPVLWLGVLQARVVPPMHTEGVLEFGDPLAFRVMTWLVHGSLPADHTLVIGPLGLAAWFGLLVTALNLMPIGQLDGGHVTYGLLRDRARQISILASWIAVALIYFGPSWILWAVLVRVLGRRHPSTLDDDAPVGRARVLVGLLALVVFVLCFVPDPIQFSWREFFDGLREMLGQLARWRPR